MRTYPNRETGLLSGITSPRPEKRQFIADLKIQLFPTGSIARVNLTVASNDIVSGLMRPHLESFSRAGRVAGPGSRPKAARCPSCKRTANTLRSKLLHTNAHRPLPLQKITIGLDQRRRITQNYARRTAEGKAQWAKWAEEIHAGKRQSFF
jgi:hypothetical protein